MTQSEWTFEVKNDDAFIVPLLDMQAHAAGSASELITG
jgi:hypothetical protein